MTRNFLTSIGVVGDGKDSCKRRSSSSVVDGAHVEKFRPAEKQGIMFAFARYLA